MNKLILVRGLPGSGKSTFAKTMPDFLHVEADMYFCKTGQYIFNPKELSDAHEWCRNITQNALQNNLSVIVTNTFTQFWEIKPYLDIGQLYGIIPTIITMNNEFLSIHNIPDEAMTRMKNRFEWNIMDKLWNYYMDTEYDNLGAV